MRVGRFVLHYIFGKAFGQELLGAPDLRIHTGEEFRRIVGDELVRRNTDALDAMLRREILLIRRFDIRSTTPLMMVSRGVHS